MLKFLPVSLYNVPAVETWLSDQARRGWHAVGFFGRLMRFQRGERKETAYRLEPQFHRAAAPDRDMLDLYADAGWECVTPAARNGFYLWRSTRPDAREVHTDPAAEDLAYAWLADIQEGPLRMTAAGMFVGVALLALAVCINRELLLPFIEPGSFYAAWLFFAALELGENLADFKAIRALRKRLVSGVPLPHAAPYRLRRWGRRMAAAAVAAVFVLALGQWKVSRGLVINREWTDFPVPSMEELGVDMPMRTPMGIQWRGLVIASESWASQFSHDAYGRELAGWNATVYCLRLPFLAGQVLRETAYSNITYDLEEAPVRLENTPFDEARYLRAEDGTQYLVARLDGWVLYYKATVPEDLRDHLDDFAAALRKFEREGDRP